MAVEEIIDPLLQQPVALAQLVIGTRRQRRDLSNFGVLRDLRAETSAMIATSKSPSYLFWIDRICTCPLRRPATLRAAPTCAPAVTRVSEAHGIQSSEITRPSDAADLDEDRMFRIRHKRHSRLDQDVGPRLASRLLFVGAVARTSKLRPEIREVIWRKENHHCLRVVHRRLDSNEVVR